LIAVGFNQEKGLAGNLPAGLFFVFAAPEKTPRHEREALFPFTVDAPEQAQKTFT